ncbi:Uncharacterised protein [Klebsiella pneumoniae]|nr:Uncharacterised protein [Klebsiella pneumoniae]SXL38336.1 Uncharacterised protein [Klebsiella pneumoniae]
MGDGIKASLQLSENFFLLRLLSSRFLSGFSCLSLGLRIPSQFILSRLKTIAGLINDGTVVAEFLSPQHTR